MQKALDAFRDSISRVHHLGGLHKAILSLTTPAIDASDLLRAQIVLAVSALDFYVHEITVAGMLEVFKGTRPATPAFEKYRVSVGAMIAGLPTGSHDWFEADVRERHSYLSFQQPDKIADAIRSFSDVKLWQSVAARLDQDEATVKATLRLIVDRRNKIAHEADLDPSYPSTRWPITESDVSASCQFLSQTVDAIHAVVA
jgi:hypothetical protein